MNNEPHENNSSLAFLVRPAPLIFLGLLLVTGVGIALDKTAVKNRLESAKKIQKVIDNPIKLTPALLEKFKANHRAQQERATLGLILILVVATGTVGLSKKS